MRIGPASIRLPAPTIRLRLTLLYGLVFLVTGAVLLTIGYVLVRHNLNQPSDYRNELRKLGLIPPGFGQRPPGFAQGSTAARIAEAVRAQLRGDALHRLLIEYLVALGAMTMVSVAAGWLLAGRALRPLRDITATARRVSGENLGERISLKGPADELKQLADTFDGMLARLDAAFGSQRHFVANASHELRTPLAIMRTEVDVSLADPDATVEELRADGRGRPRDRRSVRAADRGTADAGAERGRDRSRGACRPGPARGRLHHGPAGAGERGRRRGAGRPGAGVDEGDPALLERMIANLVDNGIQHNEPRRVSHGSRRAQRGGRVRLDGRQRWARDRSG